MDSTRTDTARVSRRVAMKGALLGSMVLAATRSGVAQGGSARRLRVLRSSLDYCVPLAVSEDGLRVLISGGSWTQQGLYIVDSQAIISSGEVVPLEELLASTGDAACLIRAGALSSNCAHVGFVRTTISATDRIDQVACLSADDGFCSGVPGQMSLETATLFGVSAQGQEWHPPAFAVADDSELLSLKMQNSGAVLEYYDQYSTGILAADLASGTPSGQTPISLATHVPSGSPNDSTGYPVVEQIDATHVRLYSVDSQSRVSAGPTPTIELNGKFLGSVRAGHGCIAYTLTSEHMDQVSVNCYHEDTGMTESWPYDAAHLHIEARALLPNAGVLLSIATFASTPKRASVGIWEYSE